eukprot:1097396-Pyramimonas_sp.AAC.1
MAAMMCENTERLAVPLKYLNQMVLSASITAALHTASSAASRTRLAPGQAHLACVSRGILSIQDETRSGCSRRAEC